jgi:hypothetical protein
MPVRPKINLREFYLTAPFGRERWIADRYNVPFERVKSAFQAMDLCEFAGSAEIIAEMLSDWPPQLESTKPISKLNPPVKQESPPARVVRTTDIARSLANSHDPKIKAAVDRARAIEAQRARVTPVCCSFCGKAILRAGTMLESQDWQNPDRLVRICRQCAEMAMVLIDFDADGQSNKPRPESSLRAASH